MPQPHTVNGSPITPVGVGKRGHIYRLLAHSPRTTCERYRQDASVAGLVDTGRIAEDFRKTKHRTPTCTARTRAQITHVVIGKHQPLTREKVRGSDRHGDGPADGMVLSGSRLYNPRSRRAGGPDRIYKRAIQDQTDGIIAIKQHYSISGAAE